MALVRHGQGDGGRQSVGSEGPGVVGRPSGRDRELLGPVHPQFPEPHGQPRRAEHLEERRDHQDGVRCLQLLGPVQSVTTRAAQPRRADQPPGQPCELRTGVEPPEQCGNRDRAAEQQPGGHTVERVDDAVLRTAEQAYRVAIGQRLRHRSPPCSLHHLLYTAATSRVTPRTDGPAEHDGRRHRLSRETPQDNTGTSEITGYATN